MEKAPDDSEVKSRKLGGIEVKCADGTHLPRQSRVRQQTTSRVLNDPAREKSPQQRIEVNMKCQ
jgi:hypothetical protein